MPRKVSHPGSHHCQEILDNLDIPEPFELATFIAYLVSVRGRRINVRPFRAKQGLCGVWIRARQVDYIYYDEHTTDLHRTHIVVHEIAHMLLGHQGTSLIAGELSPLLAPSLGAELIGTMLGRGGAYASPQEREAELLASVILERASRPSPREPVASVPHMPKRAIVAERLDHVMGKGQRAPR